MNDPRSARGYIAELCLQYECSLAQVARLSGLSSSTVRDLFTGRTVIGTTRVHRILGETLARQMIAYGRAPIN